MRFKINGGTPKGGKSLCVSCRNAKTIKGQNCEEVILCGYFRQTASYGQVPFKVAECTEYHPMNMPWKHEMEEMAWTIQARKRGPSGFKPDAPLEVTITPPKGDPYGPED